MIVAHNLVAMNTNRQFGIVNGNQAKSTEKLSSGYKINRAADDAAGLAISEKMRRQIRGLTQASLNCQDGISLVQVADGALSEMTDIMQRMNELSVKAANGTLQVDDREAIQSEINQLTKELRRIQDSTSFNEQLLFKGKRAIEMDADDYTNVELDETATVEGKNVKYSKAMDFGGIQTAEDKQQLAGKSFQVTCSQSCSQVFTFSFIEGGGGKSKAEMDGVNMSVVVDLDDCNNGTDIAQKVYDLAASKTSEITNAPATFSVNIGHANALDVQGSKLIFFSNCDSPNARIKAAQFNEADRELIIQAGSEAGQIIKIGMFNVGPGTLGVSGMDVTTQPSASEAIDKVKGGIMKLNEYRSYYGAMQNRLEHTIKNLDNIVENTTAAESQIRDTDMASEMVRYSNNNILLQAGSAMLAQANQSNQNVLSLLQ